MQFSNIHASFSFLWRCQSIPGPRTLPVAIEALWHNLVANVGPGGFLHSRRFSSLQKVFFNQVSQNYKKLPKQHSQVNYSTSVCASVFLQCPGVNSAKGSQHMVQKPCPVPRCPETPQKHMVQVTWSTEQYDIKKIKLVEKNLLFLHCIENVLKWLELTSQINCLIVYFDFTESSTCLKRIIGSSAHLGFQDLELPVIHLCLQVSTSCQPYWFLHFILFYFFNLKWNWFVQFDSIYIGLCLVHFTLNFFP